MKEYSNMISLSRFLVIPAAIGAGLSFAPPVSSANLSSQDKKFLMDAAKGNMMEVHMGQAGLEHGTSDPVKTLSRRLVDDHTKAGQEVMDLAKQKGVTLPAESPSMPGSLTSKTGAAYDKAFAKMAVTDHEKDIAEFEKEASSGTDPDVKEWANKTLPTLRAHLDLAKAAEAANK
jgi:putative membrane protein